MYAGFPEEGDSCSQAKCQGTLRFPQVENCSCHISPPCHACTSQRLTCDACGWVDDSPEETYVPVAPGLSMLEQRPRPLDATKIDYRVKLHSASTMIKEGVYPNGATATEVAEVVKGTFGGRFESFGNGRFKYIAYTD
jgi:hypothetical protein